MFCCIDVLSGCSLTSVGIVPTFLVTSREGTCRKLK